MSSGPGQPPPPPQQPPPPGQAGGAYPPPAGAGTPPGAPGTPPGAPPGVPGPYEHKTPWTAYIKPTIWTLVAIYVIAFVFLTGRSPAPTEDAPPCRSCPLDAPGIRAPEPAV